MKVWELINELGTYPPDATVFVHGEAFEHAPDGTRLELRLVGPERDQLSINVQTG